MLVYASASSFLFVLFCVSPRQVIKKPHCENTGSINLVLVKNHQQHSVSHLATVYQKTSLQNIFMFLYWKKMYKPLSYKLSHILTIIEMSYSLISNSCFCLYSRLLQHAYTHVSVHVKTITHILTKHDKIFLLSSHGPNKTALSKTTLPQHLGQLYKYIPLIR